MDTVDTAPSAAISRYWSDGISPPLQPSPTMKSEILPVAIEAAA